MPLLDHKTFHGKQREAILALIRIFGDDTNAVLNGLHEMAARLAIVTGVSPDDYSAGMKHHWDCLANAINEIADRRADTTT